MRVGKKAGAGHSGSGLSGLRCRNARRRSFHGGRASVIQEQASAGIQCGDARHIFLIQNKVENGEVFGHAFRADALGNGDDVSLQQPAQHDLGHAFSVFFCDGEQHRIMEHVVSAFGKGAPGFRAHAVFLHDGHGFLLLAERVSLHLIHGGDDFVVKNEVDQPVRLKIAYAYGADFSFTVQLFHGAPGAVHVAVGLMDEVQVHIVHSETLQRGGKGCLRRFVARILYPQLRGEKYFFTF